MCLIVYKFGIFWSFRPICSKLKKKNIYSPKSHHFPEVDWNAVAIFHLEGDIPTKPGFPWINTISKWQHVSSFDLRLSYVLTYCLSPLLAVVKVKVRNRSLSHGTWPGCRIYASLRAWLAGSKTKNDHIFWSIEFFSKLRYYKFFTGSKSFSFES